MRHRPGLKRTGARLVLTAVLGFWCFDIVAAQEAPVSQTAPTQNDSPTPDVGAAKVQSSQERDENRRNKRRKAEAAIKQTEKGAKKSEVSPPRAAAPAVPQTPPPAGPIQPAPAAPQSPSEPIGEFEPVVHARNAKIGTCMDKIVGLSARVIDRPHSSVSTYVSASPNDHIFQSIIGMSYPNKLAPNGAAVIVAAPINGTRCEGETVQIYPTTNSCTAVQASLINNGQTLTTLQSLPLLQTKDGNRELLMPTAGGGCVVISVGLH